MLSGEVFLSSFIRAGHMNCAFPFDIAYHLCNRILRRYLDQHMDMIYHQMPFDDSRFLSHPLSPSLWLGSQPECFLEGVQEIQTRQGHHERQDCNHDCQRYHGVGSLSFASSVKLITHDPRKEHIERLIDLIDIPQAGAGRSSSGCRSISEAPRLTVFSR